MTPEHFIIHENGWVPNNERLPVLLYRTAIPLNGTAAAERFEALFRDHGWEPRWRDTVYDHHHYHSTAHEALGVFAGYARLVLGGPNGWPFEVSAGDALVLPAGVGHCRTEASEDFQVVGAYPPGQDWDMCREIPTAEARQRIASLLIPEQDPVTGADGALTRLWTVR